MHQFWQSLSWHNQYFSFIVRLNLESNTYSKSIGEMHRKSTKSFQVVGLHISIHIARCVGRHGTLWIPLCSKAVQATLQWWSNKFSHEFVIILPKPISTSQSIFRYPMPYHMYFTTRIHSSASWNVSIVGCFRRPRLFLARLGIKRSLRMSE